MTQVSLRSRQLRYLLSSPLVNRLKDSVITILSQKRWQKRGLCLVGSTGLTVMISWDWKLVLATTTGMGLMILVYQIQTQNWEHRWLDWREFFKSFQGKLAVAVSSGGLSAVGTYIAASIWSDAENRWLATGAIIQGMGTLLTLGLLGWQILQLREKGEESQFNRWVSDLTENDSLKRLIAVRNLLNLLKKEELNSHYQQQLKDYFQLMLGQETEPLVRQGILEGLQLLDRHKMTALSPQKVINLKPELRQKKIEIILRK